MHDVILFSGEYINTVQASRKRIYSVYNYRGRIFPKKVETIQ